MSRPTPPGHPSSAVDEVGRRQRIVDLARLGRRVGGASVGHSQHDQDAWVAGDITLDELVALSQGTIALAALTANPRSSAPTAESRLAEAVRSDTEAVAALAEAITSARGAEMAAANNLEVLAVVAATETRTAVAVAATKALQAAGTARAAQSAAASKTAAATAETVRQAAHFLQLRADEDAERVHSAADEAAYLVALAVMPGTEAVNAERAALLAASIRAAAIAKAEETALAAATVARAAATAAADAATRAADAAMALELQVADTAAAVQAVAAATARRVAVDTLRAAELVLASGR